MFKKFIKNPPPVPEPMHPNRMSARIQGMKNEGIYFVHTLIGPIHVDALQASCDIAWARHQEKEKNT